MLAEARELLARQDPVDAERFSRLERYCAFVGQPRSGHSVLGTLINAHRHALVSHNLDALRYVRLGLRPNDLFRLVLERDRAFAASGRKWGRYSYELPGQWHGYYDEIRVVGDKRAGATSRHLEQEPALLRELPARLGLPVTLIHHVRNPWDNVASIWQWDLTRRGRSLRAVAEAWLARSEAAARGLAEAGSAVRLVRTHQEELTRDPRALVARVLEGLSLPADAAYLDACVRFVERKPRHTRHEVRWPAGLVAAIGEHAARCDFLAHYRFEST